MPSLAEPSTICWAGGGFIGAAILVVLFESNMST